MASSSSSSGIGFFGVLACVFIALKLMGTIQWSWFWVLSPIWVPAVIVLVIVALIFGVAYYENKFHSRMGGL